VNGNMNNAGTRARYIHLLFFTMHLFIKKKKMQNAKMKKKKNEKKKKEKIKKVFITVPFLQPMERSPSSTYHQDGVPHHHGERLSNDWSFPHSSQPHQDCESWSSSEAW
jgi:hypothetical protein